MFVVTDADAEVRVPVYERFEWKHDAELFIADSAHVELTLFREDHWVSFDNTMFGYGPLYSQEDAQEVKERKEQEFPDNHFYTSVELVREG